MIEINLLPETLRKRRVIHFTIPKGYLKNSLFFAIAFIAALHILIQAIIIANGVMLTSVRKRMAVIQPQRQLVDGMKSEVQRYKDLQDFFSQAVIRRMRCAAVLNLISDVMPNGVWLTELSLSEGSGELSGACVSLEGNEIARIGNLLDALKHNPELSRVFPEIELASVKRKKLGPSEIVEFLMSSKKHLKGPKNK